MVSKHCQTEPTASLLSEPKVEPRVTFDLGPSKGGATAAAAATAAASSDLLRRPADKPPSQLPSDARQRLQEMAGLDIRRNYRKTSENFRPTHLNLTAAAVSTTAATSNNNNTAVLAVSRSSAAASALPSPSPAAHVATTTAGRISPTKAYPIGAVMPTGEPNNHHHLKSGGNGNSSANVTASALMRKDSRSNARNSLVTVQNSNNNQKRPLGGAVVAGSREAVMNNPARNAINGNRTRTPSIERSIISNKEDQKDANKVRPKSFWGGWWKF